MEHQWGRTLHPGFAAAFIAAAAGWSLFSWLIPNRLIVALSVAIEMTIVLTLKAGRIEPHWHREWAMAAMVGGTAGGLIGGLIACAGAIDAVGTMAVMTASMAGMIGGTLGGWRFYG